MNNFENYIPVRLCEFEVNNNIVTVHYNQFEKTWIDKLLKPKKQKIAKINFDRIGSFVWLNCEGDNDVRSIIKKTKEQFHSEKSIEERVNLFLSQLEGKNFIRFYERKKV